MITCLCSHSLVQSLQHKGHIWQQRQRKRVEWQRIVTVIHLSNVSDCNMWSFGGSQRAGVALPLKSNWETLVHTWCGMLADGNWNSCVPVLCGVFFHLLPLLCSLKLVPSYNHSLLLPAFLFSTPALSPWLRCFLYTRSFFCPYHFPVTWLLSQSRVSMVLWNYVLGFTQCAWHKLMRVRCFLSVVLP